MKNSFKRILVVGVLGLATQAQASLLDVAAFGGYTTLGMGQVNDGLDGGNPGATVTKINSGYYVGLEAGIPVLPFLKIGPRVEYIGSGQGKADFGFAAFTTDAALIPLMLGVSTDWKVPQTGLIIQGGLWGGYGLGTLKSSLSGPNPGSARYDGNGFVGEVGAQARYSVLPSLSLGLDLGYRLANITKMTLGSADGAYVGLAPDRLLKPNSTDDASVDFSGLNVGATLAFSF